MPPIVNERAQAVYHRDLKNIYLRLPFRAYCGAPILIPHLEARAITKLICQTYSIMPLVNVYVNVNAASNTHTLNPHEQGRAAPHD